MSLPTWKCRAHRTAEVASSSGTFRCFEGWVGTLVGTNRNLDVKALFRSVFFEVAA